MSIYEDHLYQQAYDEVYAEYKKTILKKVLKNDIGKVIDYVVQNPFNLLKVREAYDQKVQEKYKDIVFTPKTYMEINASSRGEALYVACEKFISTYYDKGVYAGGYYPATNQFALKVKFDQNRPLEHQLGILDFVEYLKPFEGTKHIGVFEYTLSEDGVYCILVSDKTKLIKTTYGHDRTIRMFDTLLECLRYVYEYHPYEKKKFKDNEDYD
jgi:hypothetical protein